MKTSIFEKYKKMPELDVFACILKNELIHLLPSGT